MTGIAPWRLAAPPSPPEHVVDRHGYVWRVVRDGGMVTRADDTGLITMGVVAAEQQVGPLRPLTAGEPPLASVRTPRTNADPALAPGDVAALQATHRARMAWMYEGGPLPAFAHPRLVEADVMFRAAEAGAQGIAERLAREVWPDHPPRLDGAVLRWDPATSCRHPDCDETNWGGRSRVHLRGETCPPDPAGEHLAVQRWDVP